MNGSTPHGIVTMPAPESMPVLGRGRHRSPSQGACFLEYTALLAGEAFTDRPRCVDGELAAVLRNANDRLSDADRPLLVPLLGRAIGLGVEPPPPGDGGFRRAALRRRRERAPYREGAARLRREVTRRFVAALGPVSAPAPRAWSGRSGELAQLFWDTMSEPTPLSTSPAYVRRLVERLSLLHECYERAMAELGVVRTPSAAPLPAVPGPVTGA
ncbi:hypothetical protein ACI780_11950 [Geodermatophilus sp. SYSU D00814]